MEAALYQHSGRACEWQRAVRGPVGCVWEWQCCQLPEGQGSKGTVSAQLCARAAWAAQPQLLLWHPVGLQSLTAFPSSQCWESRRGPWAVLMAVLVSFLRYSFSGGGGLSQSLGFAVPLAAFPKSTGPQACPTFPIPSCPQLLHLASFTRLAHARCLGYCL